MDLRDFKSGTYTQQRQYKSFRPSPINHTWIWSNPKINTLLEEANHKLGALDAFSRQLPNVDYFIRMHVIKEATTSSRIEGTKTSIEEALLAGNEVGPERRDDWQEVQNYIAAMNHAVKRLRKVPVSTRLLRETHNILLRKGRGSTKTPGEYRRSQNWIGGSSLKDAVFIPPSHEEVDPLMSDLENFLHNDAIDVPHLVRIAIGHYQFETIHPFLDGNGRVGRLLITLYLVDKGLLTEPTLYLSDYFDRHRLLYYDNLTAARARNDLAQWIMFFLVAVAETCNKGITTLKKIQKLREDVEGKRIVRLGKRLPKASALVMNLYRNPRVTATETAQMLDVTSKTANELIQNFVDLHILVESTGYKRNRVFSFAEYVRLFT
ncbi:MAG: Fic family protein [Ignavibacteriales bacterium]|nr:Fic family protein [Ignavibacteriales bacterium]